MKINNITLTGQLVPASLTVVHTDISGGDVTDATGTVHRYYLGKKATLNCSWNITSETDAALLIAETEKSSLSITYRNPKTGADETITAYRDGDVSVEVYSMYGGKMPYYKTITMTFKEF